MKIVISNSSKLPIYEQIVVALKQAIICNELEKNQQLPSIRSLAKELQISVITTKRAYDELEKQGFIQTVAGKGCYVSYFNDELIYEEKLKEIEKGLESIITKAKMINLSKEEIFEIINLLY